MVVFSFKNCFYHGQWGDLELFGIYIAGILKNRINISIFVYYFLVHCYSELRILNWSWIRALYIAEWNPPADADEDCGCGCGCGWWFRMRMRMRIVNDWQHNTFFVYLADADADAVWTRLNPVGEFLQKYMQINALSIAGLQNALYFIRVQDVIMAG